MRSETVTDYFPLGGPEWRSISPVFVTVRTLTRLIWYPIFTAIVVVPTWIFAGWQWAVPVAVVLAIWLAWLTTRARAWCRTFRFALRERELIVSEGLLSRNLIAIPYGRIQTVSVGDGPLDRTWGLANVSVNTASDKDATIPGLPAQEAAALRDELIELSEIHAIAL